MVEAGCGGNSAPLGRASLSAGPALLSPDATVSGLEAAAAARIDFVSELFQTKSGSISILATIASMTSSEGRCL